MFLMCFSIIFVAMGSFEMKHLPYNIYSEQWLKIPRWRPKIFYPTGNRMIGTQLIFETEN